MLALEPTRGSDGRTLVVADLHLGLGLPERKDTGIAERTAREMAEDLVRAAEVERAEAILVAGDSKHTIAGVPPPARDLVFDFFSTLLSAGVRAEVILGNHDAGLVRHLPREVVVHGASGLALHGIGVFHGHRWPSDEVLRARTLVVGHLHPGFRFAPTAEDRTGKTRCWVRARYPPIGPVRPSPAGRRRTGARRRLRARELIVLPAFNPLSGIESLNKSAPARGRSFLFRRFLGPAVEARAYLLDGTDVGPIVTPESPRGPPQEAEERVARAR
jgi:metallophosphoesterase superfamily enzyme